MKSTHLLIGVVKSERSEKKPEATAAGPFGINTISQVGNDLAQILRRRGEYLAHYCGIGCRCINLESEVFGEILGESAMKQGGQG